ncbi:hypothetical protein ATE47_01400 [Chryseobacterium sp. IHB B 17019]|nr:hypothetical protein ATE47_01400 [Chryseobacterium sp. IHB B 17019]
MIIPFILPFLALNAQIIKPLKIGDKVPDLYFSKMLNHSSSKGRLSDFQGKAIIIDMWFHTCAPCIGSMPHLDSLQQEFKNDLQVLLVTWESEPEILEFWKKNTEVNKLKFTQAVEDTLLRKLFPAVSFPHQIWIDKSGVVVAITNGKSSTRVNIRKLVENSDLEISEKKEELDSKIRWGIEPLMNIRYLENKDKIISYSYFSKRRAEFNGSITHEIDTVNRLVRIKFSNIDYAMLYDYAYKSSMMDNASFNRANRLIRRDHTNLPVDYDGKNFTTSFCYDLIYKDSTKTLNNFGKYMVADLDRNLNVKSREATRNIPCYVIRPNGKGTRYRETLDPDGKKQLYNRSLKPHKIFYVSRQLPSFTEYVINTTLPTPVLFEFGSERSMNFEVLWDLNDLKKMNKTLAKFDVKIERTKRRRKVIILEDPN